MRPRLHPDMGEVVICARVSLQLSVLLANWDQPRLEPAWRYPSQAAINLPPDYPGMLRFALHSLSVYLGLGYPSIVWLNSVLEAAHYGHSFRRCFFFDYKANRGPTPRVTNRGGHFRQPATLTWEEEVSNDA